MKTDDEDGKRNMAAIASALGSNGTRSFAGLKDRVETLSDDLLRTLFPSHLARCGQITWGEEWLQGLLERAIEAFSFVAGDCQDANGWSLIQSLPRIKELLEKDIESAYQGDPAATSLDEIILTYPAFMAIGTHRLAHCVFEMGIPLIPRIMSEHAHRMTGIDIHPGASIGPWFFIDHGTGVVIGETTTIGNHVKLYQQVTIGAKSFAVGPDGSLAKGLKRHPDIGNNVIIYAGATILGGNTKIGDGAVIGGNVWLTHSVAPGETVMAEAPQLRRKFKQPTQR